MSRLHLSLLLAGSCQLLASAGHAQGLNTQDCEEIRRSYGIVLPQCAGAEAPVGIDSLSRPTQKEREDNVFFPEGGAALDSVALAQIGRLARVLNTTAMGGSCLKLVGHSDSTGDAELNRQMGVRRAVAVREVLAAQIDTPARIATIESRGEDRPIARLPSNSPWQRRVEIWAQPCPPP